MEMVLIKLRCLGLGDFGALSRQIIVRLVDGDNGVRAGSFRLTSAGHGPLFASLRQCSTC